MADFDMWGPAQNGARLYQQDVQQQRLNDLATQEGYQRLQQRQMQTVQMQQQAQQQQRQQQALQELAVRDQNKSLYEFGEDVMKAGNIKEGAAILQAASQMDLRFSQADKNRAATSEKQLEERGRVIGMLGGALEGAETQEDYNKVVDMVEKHIGQRLPDQVRNATFTPELKNRLLNMATSAKDQLRNQVDKQRLAMQESRKQTQERLDQARLAETEARTAAIKNKETREVKEGKMTAIPKTELKAAFNLMKQDFPSLNEDDPEGMNGAYYVAGQARRLLTTNRGLDQGTAMQQAYQRAKKDGVINEKIIPHIFSKDEHKASFDSSKVQQAKEPSKMEQTAPSAAVTYLKQHPELKDKFKQKYGYLPEGM